MTTDSNNAATPPAQADQAVYRVFVWLDQSRVPAENIAFMTTAAAFETNKYEGHPDIIPLDGGKPVTGQEAQNLLWGHNLILGRQASRPAPAGGAAPSGKTPG